MSNTGEADFNSLYTHVQLTYQFPPEWNVTHTLKHWSNEATMTKYVEKNHHTLHQQYLGSLRR